MALSLSLQALFFAPSSHGIDTNQLQPLFAKGSTMSQTAVVSSPILPGKRGRVRYQATYWFAVTQVWTRTPLSVGKRVRVIDRRGNTLVVEPTP